jgi:hypothetical protein
MATYRKNHLLFFLLTLIPMQLISPSISSPVDYLPVSWGPDDSERACYRVYHGESLENYGHIIDVKNVKLPAHKAGLARHLPVILYRSSWKPYPQVLRDLRGHSLAKNHLGKSFPYRYTPPIAQNITPNPSPKATMRTTITPLVLLSNFLVATTLTDKIVYLLFVVCYSLCIFSWLIKKHPNI